MSQVSNFEVDFATPSLERTIFAAIFGHRLVFSCVFLLLGGGWSFYWSRAPRVYEAASYVLVNSDRLSSEQNGRSSDMLDLTFVNSQAQLLKTQGLMARAINQVGIENFRTKSLLPFAAPDGEASDETIRRLADLLNVQIEPHSSLIRISFSNTDPRLASDVVNAVVTNYLADFKRLYSDTRTVDYLRTRIRQLESDIATASAKLSDFNRQNKLYAADLQMNLLLTKMADLRASEAIHKSALVQKISEQSSVQSQLAQLRPGIMTSSVIGGAARNQGGLPIQEKSFLASDPPLLLVKVYQETAQLLVKLTSEKAGLSATTDFIMAEYKSLQHDLDDLVDKNAELTLLQSAVADGKHELEMVRRKSEEENLRVGLASRDLANVQVAEAATPPSTPTSPTTLTLFGGLGLAAIMSFCLVVVLHLRSARSTR